MTINIHKKTGFIKKVHIEDFMMEESFVDFTSRFASMPGTVALVSGGDLDCAGFNILATLPWLIFKAKGRNITLTSGEHTNSFEAGPFDTIKKLITAYRLDSIDFPGPVASGLFGYLSYDLKDHLENLPRTSIDDMNLPQAVLFVPSVIVLQDRKSKRTCLCIPERNIKGKSSLEKIKKNFENLLNQAPNKGHYSVDATGLRSAFTKDGYMEAVRAIKDYITSGHVYQVNMSQRFETGFKGDPFSLFKTLFNKNPAPFFAYINAGDHQVVSTSPERFIQRIGPDVETRPIKGTRPRGQTVQEDQQNQDKLLQSRKDSAELSMIVDLLRNDLGKVCEGGSVCVAEHKRLEAYENVYHLISIIKGRLARGKDSIDLIRATFPGGSITGCPKIRSMEIIDELEPVRRHLYTGAIGYISFHDTMDLSIAIRTAIIYKDKLVFSVGGGVVFDSDPLEEYEETLHKGRTLMDTFKTQMADINSEQYVWINGSIKSADEAAVPIMNQGFQYGFGFFETIRADKGHPFFLKEHIERFYTSWEALFKEPPPDLTWEDIIRQVLTKNCLLEQTAAVKIMVTKGSREEPPYDHTFVVTARSYIHRLEGLDKKGIDLATYPEPRQTPLADHKTMNYLYYFLAGKWAKENNADEALILNPDKTISETNTANIMLINGKTVLKPVSDHVLPGVMEKAFSKVLDEWGYQIEAKEIKVDDIYSAKDVILTNSLMGAVPVVSLDNKKLQPNSNLWEKLNKEVFKG